jgi:hypothetical protein
LAHTAVSGRKCSTSKGFGLLGAISASADVVQRY